MAHHFPPLHWRKQSEENRASSPLHWRNRMKDECVIPHCTGESWAKEYCLSAHYIADWRKQNERTLQCSPFHWRKQSDRTVRHSPLHWRTLSERILHQCPLHDIADLRKQSERIVHQSPLHWRKQWLKSVSFPAVLEKGEWKNIASVLIALEKAVIEQCHSPLRWMKSEVSAALCHLSPLHSREQSGWNKCHVILHHGDSSLTECRVNSAQFHSHGIVPLFSSRRGLNEHHFWQTANWILYPRYCGSTNVFFCHVVSCLNIWKACKCLALSCWTEFYLPCEWATFRSWIPVQSRIIFQKMYIPGCELVSSEIYLFLLFPSQLHANFEERQHRITAKWVNGEGTVCRPSWLSNQKLWIVLNF